MTAIEQYFYVLPFASSCRIIEFEIGTHSSERFPVWRLMLSVEMEFSPRERVHEGKSYREGGNWQFCIMWDRKCFTGRGGE